MVQNLLQYILNISAIIFCRIGSQRLKAKATQKINNLTLLENVIENTKKIKGLKKIILATTNRKRDDILVKIAKKKNC